MMPLFMIMMVVLMRVVIVVCMVATLSMFPWARLLFVTMRRSLMDAELHSLDMLAGLPFEMHVEIPDFDFCEFPLQNRGRNPEVA